MNNTKRIDGRPMGRKTTITEIANRVSIVMDLIGKHKSRQQIIEWCRTENCYWDATAETNARYYHGALAKIESMSSESEVSAKSSAILELRTIYKMAMEKGNVSAALMARKELNKLQGLYEGVIEPEIEPEGDENIDDLLDKLSGSPEPQEVEEDVLEPEVDIM